LGSGSFLLKNYVKIGVCMAKEIHDVIVNMDIMLGVASESREEAYEQVENYTTEQLLELALEQLPLTTLNGTRVGEIATKATIN
jgi:hypothetical protein|tara:strand:+ start:614 stop:865 length:252 start_codon:yes stop_codon:yes gene_type:complete